MRELISLQIVTIQSHFTGAFRSAHRVGEVRMEVWECGESSRRSEKNLATKLLDWSGFTGIKLQHFLFVWFLLTNSERILTRLVDDLESE